MAKTSAGMLDDRKEFQRVKFYTSRNADMILTSLETCSPGKMIEQPQWLVRIFTRDVVNKIIVNFSNSFC